MRPAGAAAQTALTRLTAYSTTAGIVSNESSVRDMAMHTTDWQSVYVVTPLRVWSGTVAADASSSSWTNFTADLTPGVDLLAGPDLGPGPDFLATLATAWTELPYGPPLPPVLVLPLVIARGERVGARGVVGALIAVGGTALIALA